MTVAKISTTITKAFLDMKMQDLEESGYFIEFKEKKPFWIKRLAKFDTNHDDLKESIVFLVGNKPHRFVAISIWEVCKDFIPEKYQPAISTEHAYAIKCISTEKQVICSGAGDNCHNDLCDHFGAHKKTSHCSDVCKGNHCVEVDN